MDSIKIILDVLFIICALVNIILSIIKWVFTEENTFSTICGWFCAILFCLYNLLT